MSSGTISVVKTSRDDNVCGKRVHDGYERDLSRCAHQNGVINVRARAQVCTRV